MNETAEHKASGPPRRSRGERAFDWITYGGFAGVGTFVVTVPFAYLLKHYPPMQPNPNFAAHLERQVDKEALVLFICRSGVRSDQAARLATTLGYGSCYNVLEGFEGDKDASDQRNKVGGWRKAGLPWYQG